MDKLNAPDLMADGANAITNGFRQILDNILKYKIFWTFSNKFLTNFLNVNQKSRWLRNVQNFILHITVFL